MIRCLTCKVDTMRCKATYDLFKKEEILDYASFMLDLKIDLLRCVINDYSLMTNRKAASFIPIQSAVGRKDAPETSPRTARGSVNYNYLNNELIN